MKKVITHILFLVVLMQFCSTALYAEFEPDFINQDLPPLSPLIESLMAPQQDEPTIVSEPTPPTVQQTQPSEEESVSSYSPFFDDPRPSSDTEFVQVEINYAVFGAIVGVFGLLVAYKYFSSQRSFL